MTGPSLVPASSIFSPAGEILYDSYSFTHTGNSRRELCMGPGHDSSKGLRATRIAMVHSTVAQLWWQLTSLDPTSVPIALWLPNTNRQGKLPPAAAGLPRVCPPYQ